jgi:2,4-dienoyl-CoA reductase-like NADH-dependent reductase (Old Yellow Enzyme family)
LSDILFQPLTLKRRTLRNRLAAQAMEGNDGEDGGKPSARTIERYQKLAEGGWGLVVVEALSVVESSLARVNGMTLNKSGLDAFKRLAGRVKETNPDVCLLFQLTHSGGQSGTFSDRVTLGPERAGYRRLGTDEIDRIRDAFAAASLLAEQAGADGVDLKMCHGYLGAEMLRPANTRADKWGGSFENRTRFLREVVSSARAAVAGDDFIIGSRVSMYEGIRGGCGTAGPDEIVEDLAEMGEIIRLMARLGMDYVNVSAGIPALTGAITRPTEPSKYLALHHLRYAKLATELINSESLAMKVIGSAYSSFKQEAPAVCAEMLQKKYVDICGFGRQSFADPLTPAKVQSGEKAAWCVLCSGCTKLMVSQRNDGCVVYNDYYKQELKKLNAQ